MSSDLPFTKGPDTIASVISLWRYPVKSMMGEELATVDLTERGLLGDRQYALIDAGTGKVASAKNPRKWATLFDCRATFVQRPSAASHAPRIQITLPDGTTVTSDQNDVAAQLSKAFGREVRLASTAPANPTLEEYWPPVEGLPHSDIVTDEAIPSAAFFDSAPLHLLTSATLDQLTALYPAGRFEPRRFRRNIYMTLSARDSGFVENGWIGRTLCIGEHVQLDITGPCPRCVMTTLPQGDLPQDLNVLQTAVKANQGGVGIYATVRRGGTIRRHGVARTRGAS